VVLLDRDELSPGESCFAQLRLEEEIAVRRGDKFIIRFYSPMETIGGGEIIEPVPTKKKRFDENLIEELKVKEKGSNTDVIEKIIRENSKLIPSVAELATITALSAEEIKINMDILEEEDKITILRLKNDIYTYHKDYERDFEMKIEKYLFRFHEENKYKKGVKKSEIKSKFFSKIKQPVFDSLLQEMVIRGTIKSEGENISQSFFQIKYDDDYVNAENKMLNILNDIGYDFMKPDDLYSMSFKNIKTEDLISLMINDKKIIKVNEDCITSQENYENAKNILIEFIKTNGKITAAEYRDLLNTNRKNAILLLEHFDIARVTKRSGNDRILF
jgi:selenocysteine-specific elongation factor